MILIMRICLAVNVPDPINAGTLEYGRSYEFQLPFSNPEDYSRTVVLSVTPRAMYLNPFLFLSSNRLELGPKETEAVILTISTNGSLSHGEHILTILPEEYVGGSGMATIASRVVEVHFSLPGEVRKEAQMESLAITNEGDRVRLDLNMKNTGNVRVGAFPIVDISRYYGSSEVFLSSVKGNTQYLIEPQASQTLVLYYTPLSNGKYKATAKATYDGAETNSLVKEFDVGESSQGGGNGDKGTETSGGSSSSQPASGGQNVPTVDIGGVLIGETTGLQGKAEENVSSKLEEPPELRISQLDFKVIERGAVSVLLGIENIRNSSAKYNASVKVFDVNENLVQEFYREGELGRYGSELLEMAADKLTSEGNYRIDAHLSYGNQSADKTALAALEFPENTGGILDGLYSAITGQFAGAMSGDQMTTLLVFVAVLLGAVYLRGKRL